MKLDKLKRIEYEVTNKSYEKSNKGRAIAWDIISGFFQILNIIISFFFIYLFLCEIVDEFMYRDIIFGGLSVIILGLWEFLKRNTLRTIALKYLKKTNNFSSYIVEVVLSIILITGSGFMAIHGAKSISDKTEVVEQTTNTNIDKQITLIDSTYTAKTNLLEEKIKFFYETAKLNKRTLFGSEKEFVKDLEAKVIEINLEKEDKIKLVKNSSETVLTKELDKNNDKTFIFLLITIVIETFILIGIVYVANFDFISYNETIKSESYNTFQEYDKLLDIVFQSGKHQKDDKVYSVDNLHELALYKFKDIKKGKVQKFMNFLKSSDVIRKEGRVNVFSTNYQDSKVILKNYFNY